MNTYYGKEVKMGGAWYTIQYKACDYREAVQRFKHEYAVGKKSPIGEIVEDIRGRFIKREGF